MRIIGLTGGIATGKSTIARYFAARGIPVIDADQLARAAVLPGSPSLERIAALFGLNILAHDGTLNRKRLGDIIFPDPAQRQQLEAILHPEIRRLAEEQIAHAAANGHQRLIYMAPLLIEAGATDRVDDIWVVTVRPEVQLTRLMQRDSISREQAKLIIASQMPLAEKERFATVVIDNSGTEIETDRLLEQVWAKEMKRSNE
ncbi:MAG: dephospho-CoA kinase [Desulfuromonadaceae bacterium]|nr:dephospho-CoA kinase [Desulfuromonadaceae bacterium]MDD5104576.1 dephospho-CoA kinase [Desulfuromonadaceae bacterium]